MVWPAVDGSPMAATWSIVAGLGSSLSEEEPGAVEQFVDENGMLVGSIAFVLLMVFGIAWTAAAYHRNARQRAMAPSAAKYGLGYSRSDPFGCTRVAFPLFRAGDGREVENVMWRDGANGFPVRVFDYSFYDQWTDENGRLHRRYRHFTCAMARHNGLWPPIRILRERALDRLAQKMGLPDIELESEEFNRTFIVQCEDRRFATDLLTPEMMEVLLTTRGLVDFETKGRWLLMTTERLAASDMPGLLGVADTFVRKIPPLVWELYPKAPDAPGGADGSGASDDGLLPEEGLGLELDGLAPSVGAAMLDEHRDSPLSALRVTNHHDDWRRGRRRPKKRHEYDLDGKPVSYIEENPWG